MSAPARLPKSSRTAGADQSRARTGGGAGQRDNPDRLALDKGGWLLALASGLLLLLAAAQGYVSFRAQYTFVDHAKRAHVASILEALGLDAGEVIFALLGLALACRGRRATAERVLNVACALGSLTMNLLAADLTSPRSVTVWVLPSALYALTSDRLIAVVRRWVLTSGAGGQIEEQGSAWRALSGLVLWVLRLIFDAPGTVAGFRHWVLVVAPVAPGIRTDIPRQVGDGRLALSAVGDRPDHGADQASIDAQQHEPQDQAEPPVGDLLSRDGLAPGEKKREALIRLYERCGQLGDPRYGDRAQAAALAGEIANRIGYHPWNRAPRTGQVSGHAVARRSRASAKHRLR